MHFKLNNQSLSISPLPSLPPSLLPPSSHPPSLLSQNPDDILHVRSLRVESGALVDQDDEVADVLEDKETVSTRMEGGRECRFKASQPINRTPTE